MSRILNNAQCRQLDADLAELAAYRALGTVDQLAALLPEPAPLPLPLDEDIHLAAGLLADDGVDYALALEAAEAREEEHWHK